MSLDLLGFIQSDDSRCGVASIRSVLYYYGIDTTEDEIAGRCKHTYELGCTNEDMGAALLSYGLGAEVLKDSSIEDIRYWNRHHIPVIVDFITPSVNPCEGDMPNGHSAVVVDINQHDIYLLDPENGKTRKIKIEDFERVWFDWSGSERIEKDTVLDLRTMIIPFPNKLKMI